MVNNIVFAWFHSIYNKGQHDIKALCKVDLQKREVFDIQGVWVPENISSLDEEYVEMLDGTRREVVIHQDDLNEERLLLVF
jgi:hypothetical protein